MNDHIEEYCHTGLDYTEQNGNYTIIYCVLPLGHRGKHAFQTTLDGL